MFNTNPALMPLRTIAPVAKKTINWASLLTNTQKTLNIVNQAIPIVYQVKPIVKNAKTMFRVASEFTKSGNNNLNNTSISDVSTNQINNKNNEYIYDENQPSFFI